MNRAQRRSLDKKVRSKNGLSQFDKLVLASFARSAEDNMLKDGDSVRLNVDQMMARGDWKRLNPKYRAFVQQNRDTVFTAKIRSRSSGGYPVIVELDGCDTWTFWSGDLMQVKEERVEGD